MSPVAVEKGKHVAIRAVILLGGSVRPTELSRTINRSLLDLPIASGRSVLDAWQEQATALASPTGVVDVDVLLDPTSPAPRVHQINPHVTVRILRDATELRGTGGVLRDVTQAYDDDDLFLVCNGGTILTEPLVALSEKLIAAGGDVGLIASDDGLPGAVMLVRRRTLLDIREVGFIDFKEQVLPKLGAQHRIRVIRRPTAPGIPIRTGEGYIDALFAYHRLRAGRVAEVEDPFAEEWSSVFRIIEPGSQVHADATVHDAVVLEGGRVERGAVVVRSVVCARGVVHSGETIVDEVVGPSEARRRRLA